MSGNAIKKIYNYTYGDIKLTSKYKKLLEETDKCYLSVKDTLSEEQLENFEKFDDMQFELSAETAHMYFEYGFQLGLRLTAESFVYGESIEN